MPFTNAVLHLHHLKSRRNMPAHTFQGPFLGLRRCSAEEENKKVQRAPAERREVWKVLEVEIPHLLMLTFTVTNSKRTCASKIHLSNLRNRYSFNRRTVHPFQVDSQED